MSRILFEFFDGEQTLVVVGIPSAEAFGTPVIDAGQELLVSGIASEEAFGTPKFIRPPRLITTWAGGDAQQGVLHDPELGSRLAQFIPQGSDLLDVQAAVPGQNGELDALEPLVKLRDCLLLFLSVQP